MRNGIYYFVLLVFLISGCHSQPSTKRNSSGAALFSYPPLSVIHYAKNFSLEYFPRFKVVNILNRTGAHTDTLKYLLIARDIPVPPGYEQMKKITIPLTSLVAMSSMHIALADFAGSASLITGLGSFRYVSSVQVLKNIHDRKVIEIGNDGAMNNEALISLHPGMVMVDANPDASFGRYRTLEEAGIPVLLNAEWLEESPLGRAEWVKLMGALVNKEALVNKKFSLVEKEYLRLAALPLKVAHRPSAILGMPFKGIWFTPAGHSYMAQFLRDAGIEYAWSQSRGSGSLSFNFETLAPIALHADLWLNLGYITKSSEIIAQDIRFREFAPFIHHQLFNYNGKLNRLGSNDYWESGAVHPESILADLIKIAHPELLPGHKLVYYTQIH